jgi:hypothetical protein
MTTTLNDVNDVLFVCLSSSIKVYSQTKTNKKKKQTIKTIKQANDT